MFPKFPSHKNMPVLGIGKFSGGDERYKTDPKHQQQYVNQFGIVVRC